MATVTISQLGSLTPNNNTVLPVSDGSTTGKATVAEMKTAMNVGTNAAGARTVTTSAPTDNNVGTDGDIWYQVAA
jgi:hypothetical protein